MRIGDLPDPSGIARTVQAEVFRRLHELLAADGLSVDGLRLVRGWLDGPQFEDGKPKELLRLAVEEQLAAALGVAPDDMPGRAPWDALWPSEPESDQGDGC